ncbi:putative reverse transcriptase domain-containing protein [Tanacetum coccineum]
MDRGVQFLPVVEMDSGGTRVLCMIAFLFTPRCFCACGSVMDEAHASRYLIHPGADKKYYNLRDMYWWPGMKRDIAIYVKSPWILSLNFQGQSSGKEWSSGVDHLRLRWEIYFVVLADAAESVRDAIGFEYCLASSSGWTK